MSLPPGWSVRRPALDDVPAILAVVHASDIAALGHPDFSADDVREVLTAPDLDLDRDTWLAVDPAGEVRGWSYLEDSQRGPRETVEVYVHPEHGVPAQVPLLARQLARSAQRAAEFGLAAMTVRAIALPGEERWIGVLRDAGFEFVKRYARMRRPLAGVAAEPPAPPPGVRIRPVRPDDEAELRTFHRILDTAFRDTPDYQPASCQQWWEQVRALPSVAWDEWFVAECDGEAVGILQSADQTLDQNEGWVKQLAVLREHRRRGVGGALLAYAFARYAAKGREYAGLGVDLSNPIGPVRLYESVGMTPLYEGLVFERGVDADRGQPGPEGQASTRSSTTSARSSEARTR
ncbi:GNAT family N-acetyltransferase [Micromonospora sp. WMMD1102]|uniref:GNAT family N-acetyltransferase n=1 Tax=Micromonospora sp. WMMD1102 TaxID=3016105 RepID=UPI0024150D05|nr:GNAT family N-acetyltransferase [Micromonospora sp. WMMD1102]MDG4787248.1 GNAT family N-acetyltransferase [Micromonospora sp. WMMD1102]